MSKLTVIIKRNASYENGMYGMSVGHEPGGAANVTSINNEAELKKQLLDFGLNEDYVQDLVQRLATKHDSVKFDINQ